jgi:hypothetical protein
MIPYKDLCSALDRYRARVGADRVEGTLAAGGAGRILTANGHETRESYATGYAGVSAGIPEDATRAIATDAGESFEDHDPFPDLAGAGVEVRARAAGDEPDDEEHTSMNARPQAVREGGLSTETNEIDLGTADVVGEEDLPE